MYCLPQLRVLIKDLCFRHSSNLVPYSFQKTQPSFKVKLYSSLPKSNCLAQTSTSGQIIQTKARIVFRHSSKLSIKGSYVFENNYRDYVMHCSKKSLVSKDYYFSMI
jgi:hypothetical protein